MIDELSQSVSSAAPPGVATETHTAPVPATFTRVPPSAPSHPAFSILTEIETVLRDLDVIPAHIAAWIKAKLAEAKSKF